MRTLLLIIVVVSSMVQINAQERYVCCGVSVGRDPIMRHNEAFFHAFVAFVESKKAIVEDVTSSFIIEDTCCVKIVSDTITDSGEEIITISIGCGSPLKYKYVRDLQGTNSRVRDDTLLNIEYLDDKSHSVSEFYYSYFVSLDVDGNESVPLTKFHVISSSIPINNE